ncbi:ferritin family protein, partial [Oceanidesulfovibrio marinus]
MKFFKANEVAQAAVEIERKGQAFYRNVANAASAQAARDLFTFMAGEEAKHEAIFQALKNRLGEIEMPAYSNANEYQEYLEALIDSHALFSGGIAERLASEASDMVTAVNIALAFEKDTLLF